MYNNLKLSQNAMYCGSFDPLHDGHICIIKKALPLFNKLYVVVGVNLEKGNKNTLVERTNNVRNCLKSLNFLSVEVLASDGFLVDFAKRKKVKYLIRGLRSVNDFSYEAELAAANKRLNSEIETLVFFADEIYENISSTKIREKINKYKILFETGEKQHD